MTEDVDIRSHARACHITLNRPGALHALTTPMCAEILEAIGKATNDPDVDWIVIDHAPGTRGFCAGGDIRMLAESGAAGGEAARAFFATEYRMNTALHNCPKPVIALMDGVTMGGGVGLSVHGSHRIATERTTFAMPETGIGLFPDVGGGWFLPRLEGELGTWLALTGARLKGSDVVAAGVATHFVPSEQIPALSERLMSDGPGVIESFSQVVPPAGFAEHIETINSCFRYDRAEDIRDALRDAGDEWATRQADILVSKSPRTVKVALRQLREGAQFSRFEDNMRNEYRIGARQVQSDDFLEGVRAVIVDKDNSPNWSAGCLEDVSDAEIDTVFAPLPEKEELTFPA